MKDLRFTVALVLAFFFVSSGLAQTKKGCTATCECVFTHTCGCTPNTKIQACSCTSGGCEVECCATFKDGGVMCGDGYCDENPNMAFQPAAWKLCQPTEKAMAALLTERPRGSTPADKVVVTTTAGVPLEIRNLTYTVLPGGLADIDYTLYNSGAAPVVAAVVFVDVLEGESTGRSVQWIDTWLTPTGRISPNEDYHLEGTKSTIESNSRHFDGAAVRVATALFVNGEVAGDNGEDFKKFLTVHHQRVKAEYARLQALSDSPDQRAFRGALLERPKNMSIRLAHDRLSAVLAAGNTSDVRAEFARVSALIP